MVYQPLSNFLEELAQDVNPDRIVTFLRRAGHRVDGYIAQEIGPHPGKFTILIKRKKSIPTVI